MSKLVLIRGLPGSGKSTIAERFAEQGYFHIEADMFFVDDFGNYRFSPEGLPLAHDFCQRVARIMLSRGVSVVVANTFVTQKEIEPYARMAVLNRAQFHIVECEGKYASIHDVPDAVVQSMKERWEVVDGAIKTGGI